MTDSFREMIARNNWLVLDTETTGLVAPAEVIQIAIVNPEGQVLLDSLVSPAQPIPPRRHSHTWDHQSDGCGRAALGDRFGAGPQHHSRP